jgi:hypothetical protein
MDDQMKLRLILAGLNEGDIAWFDSFGCDDAEVPAPRADEIASYRRRETALNSSIAALSYAERGDSREGRLAAAIGARIADAQDRAEGVDEDE